MAQTSSETLSTDNGNASLAQKIDLLLEPSTSKIQETANPDSTKIITPGAEIILADKGTVTFHKTYGVLSKKTGDDKPELLKPGMIFDLGSATQVLATLPVFMKLMEQGLVDPDIKVSRVLQTFGSAGKETMKVSHLLSHTSGYTGQLPLHRSLIKGSPNLNSLMTRRSALHILYKEIYRSRLDNVPGKVYRQSDIGYLLLGQIMEIVSGTPLHKLFTQFVVRPFQLHSTGFIDLEQIRRKTLELSSEMVVPTAHCTWRNKEIHGEVLDEVTWALGGIASHNGLFGSAEDIIKYVSILNESIQGDSSIIPSEISRKFTGAGFLAGDKTESESKFHPYGWQHFDITNNRTIIGFWSSTGTGLWLDPATGRSLVFLSNVTQITRDLKKVKDLALRLVSACFSE
jgi:CubicO group peptidase (beta-lactamase class C family)